MQDFTPVDEITKLQTLDLAEGEGAAAEASDTVTVHYVGAIAKTGAVFQSSRDFGKPITFGLDQVIAGWKEGVPGMKVGGKRRILIPADKAYGDRPPYGSGIPANADLVFDIELIAIEGKH